MNTPLECLPCLVRQAVEAVQIAAPDPDRRESLLREILQELTSADWRGSPPALAQRTQRILRLRLDNPDPYRDIKTRMNDMARQLLPDMRRRIQAHPDPREAAVRVAIGGNLLDVGAKTQIAAHELPDHLDRIWTLPLRGDVDALFRAADQAGSILYLADNAGEIFFDRLLLEHLPAVQTTLAVRGRPVLNDATREDAALAGIPDLVPVIDNGSDAPGTLLEDCSAEFRDRFNQADLVIAKGQGNYETLSDVDRPVFFLFTVKCPFVAARIGEPVGSLVAKPGRAPASAAATG